MATISCAAAYAAASISCAVRNFLQHYPQKFINQQTSTNDIQNGSAPTPQQNQEKGVELEGLAEEVDPQLNTAMDMLRMYLEDGLISKTCQQNVIDKLKIFSSFNFEGFVKYLNQQATYYDGTKSNTLIAGGVYSYSPYPVGTTVKKVFKDEPGTNALTSLTAPSLTIYLRLTAVDPSNHGSNSRNMGFLFHEGLHGFTGRVDPDIQDAFGLPHDNSINITNYIIKNCF